MESRIKKINDEISRLKSEIESVEGQATEVYSRIVGYYRSVKNWNVGKKGEYRERLAFSTINSSRESNDLNEEPLQDMEAVSVEEVSPVTDKIIASTDKISGYSYFYRSSCPNCPAMKEILDLLPLEGEHLNVDMERGLEAASENMVFSAPTVIFQDVDGKELYRTCHPTDVENLFALDSVTA